MKYPHSLKIEGGSSGGNQDSGSGGWTPGTSGTAIYDDICDAQEDTGRGLSITAGDTKIETESAELQIFLKDETKINDLAIGMQGTLTRGSRTDKVRIKKVRIIDGMIEANTI